MISAREPKGSSNIRALRASVKIHRSRATCSGDPRVPYGFTVSTGNPLIIAAGVADDLS